MLREPPAGVAVDDAVSTQDGHLVAIHRSVSAVMLIAEAATPRKKPCTTPESNALTDTPGMRCNTGATHESARNSPGVSDRCRGTASTRAVSVS
jgi:hypothetical protein